MTSLNALFGVSTKKESIWSKSSVQGITHILPIKGTEYLQWITLVGEVFTKNNVVYTQI